MFNINPEMLALTQFFQKLQVFEFSDFICYATGRKVPGKNTAGPGMWSSLAADTSLFLQLFLSKPEFCS